MENFRERVKIKNKTKLKLKTVLFTWEFKGVEWFEICFKGDEWCEWYDADYLCFFCLYKNKLQ